MLANNPIDVTLLGTDLAAMKDFYGGKVGLDVLLESENFVTFRCGGDSRLIVTKSTTGTSEGQTKAMWRVGDVVGEVAELRRRGVEICQYDVPDGPKTVDGVADVGFALAAWFDDPGGNNIGLIQFKDGEDA